MTPSSRPCTRPAGRSGALAALTVTGVIALPVASAAAATVGPPVRVSVSDAERQGTGASERPSVSADGRYVVFVSEARDLVPGDTNGAADVFRRDRRTGATVRVSLTDGDRQVNGPNGIGQQAVSADGRHVLFQSGGTNLGPARRDTAWVRDVVAGTTRRVDSPPAGRLDNGSTGKAALSPDGTHVVFSSNQLYAPGPSRHHLWLRELVTGRITQVDVSSTEQPSNGEAGGGLWVSAGGRYVAFNDTATNLGPAEVGSSAVYLRDVRAGTTALISRTSTGMPISGQAGSPVVTPDGRYVAFAATSGSLPGDGLEVYVRDTRTGTTTWVSRRSPLTPGSAQPGGISADGRRISFVTDAPALPGDRNQTYDTYVRDLSAGSTTRISPAGSSSTTPALSLDGRTVAFDSRTPQVAADTNGLSDVYVRRLD